MKELRKESNIMLKASHPYVLHLLGVYEKREGDLIKPCLVMEYMPHGSLCTFLSSQPDVPCALRFRILHQVVLGMKYLHSLQPPIIHRDLKPANVLLNAYLDVKITDFGLSNILGSSSSRHGSCAGTLAYMPPEAITDLNYKPTKAYDVYSFGILMWSVFTGENPYGNAPNHLIVLKVPEMQRPDETALNRWDGVKIMPEAKQLMRKCWDGDAECRPSFHDCYSVTSRSVKQYEGEMDSTVEKCLEHLRRPHPSTKVDSDVSLRVSDFQQRYNQSRTPTLRDEESGALNTSDDLSTFNEKTEFAVGAIKDLMKVSGNWATT
uniref:Protein kinase domain-containing protein n=1 Tax=Leptobrachium leishanense TaxID=445787 RepID=A0A8C5QDW7_9ANUR